MQTDGQRRRFMMMNARLVFVAWYSCGLLLMLTIGVPAWLSFSNGLFLVFYALYALQIESQLGEPAALRLTRALAVGSAAFLAEWIGVSTGKPFGQYAYTSQLGFLTGGVPITMTCAWVGVITSAVLLSEGAGSRVGRAIKAGLWTVLLDLVLDPVAFVRGMWVWGNDAVSGGGAGEAIGSAFGNGGYYGIPLANFASWFLLTALLSLAYPLRRPSRQALRESARLMQLMLVMFGLLGVKAGLLLPVLIAGAGCLVLEGVVRRDSSSQKLMV